MGHKTAKISMYELEIVQELRSVQTSSITNCKLPGGRIFQSQPGIQNACKLIGASGMEAMVQES